jgi:outer membrane protein TolC
MFPSLSLNASYGRGGFDWSTFTSPQGAIWGVGASLTQPLFHGVALFARKRQYKASYDVAVDQYKQTVLSAFRTVADNLVSLDEDANTLFQTQRAEAAARDAQSDTDSRYRLGATSFFVTLTAGQQYQNAHIQYVRARASRLADTAALFDSMGNPPGVGGTTGSQYSYMFP